MRNITRYGDVMMKLFRTMKKTSKEVRNLGCETQIFPLHGSLRGCLKFHRNESRSGSFAVRTLKLP